MKYYTETISPALAEKLKEKGMPMMPCFNITQTGSFSDDDGIHFYYLPTFGACFDWLMERGLSTEVYGRGAGYDYVICKECNDCTRGTRKSKPNYDGPNDGGCWDTWHEAANAAIEKALTLI